MKKIALYSVLALFLTACDAPDVANINLKEGNKISLNNVKSTKSYMATKDDKDRQYHYFETTADLNTVYQDFSQQLEKNGYKPTVKTQEESVIQVYFKKPNSAMIVANFKQANPNQATTQAVLSWAVN
ncbi:hypothetical protein [Pseudomonas putida]|uniref:hypothetical protein n=1 Tax=Pseudomonas putida TaxID=303 RepID=UPI00235DB836|nr:hypothetical protein [Pseudomonas putida]GLO27672.1 hypothetical protein PPUJ21368_55030 [Pseudomonas putida]HDS0972495.1 hypothetical protein [Pseudomonas putida]